MGGCSIVLVSAGINTPWGHSTCPQWVIRHQTGATVAVAKQNHLGALRLCRDAARWPGHSYRTLTEPRSPTSLWCAWWTSQAPNKCDHWGYLWAFLQWSFFPLSATQLPSGSCSFGKYSHRWCLLPVNQCQKFLLPVLLEAANFPGDESLYRPCSSGVDLPRSLAGLSTFWMTPSHLVLRLVLYHSNKRV